MLRWSWDLLHPERGNVATFGCHVGKIYIAFDAIATFFGRIGHTGNTHIDHDGSFSYDREEFGFAQGSYYNQPASTVPSGSLFVSDTGSPCSCPGWCLHSTGCSWGGQRYCCGRSLRHVAFGVDLIMFQHQHDAVREQQKCMMEVPAPIFLHLPGEIHRHPWRDRWR